MAKKMPHSGLGLIECRSADSRPGSLVAFYAQIAEQAWDLPHAYSAAVVGSPRQLELAVGQVLADDEVKVLAVAGHGSPGKIRLANGGPISAKRFAQYVSAAQGSYQWLHVSACSTLTEDFAAEVFASGSKSLRWVSGYTSDVDWTQCLAADIYLLRAALDAVDNEKFIDVAALRHDIGGLADRLGMTIYQRQPTGPFRIAI